jgi:LuxR family maltose regulon positive regulatory protein
MAALSLRDNTGRIDPRIDFPDDAYYMVDFLGREILDRQPEAIRRFLLRSSILDVLSGPLCEAVAAPDAEPGSGAKFLHRLERLNLFITPLDPQHQWFRFHNLFSDFLRRTLAETNPSELPLLHTQAALWFEQHGELEAAFKHALATDNAEWVADLLDRNGMALSKMGAQSTLVRWIAKLPDALIRRHPRLGVAYAWGLVMTFQLDAARYWLDIVDQMLDAMDQSEVDAADPADNRAEWSVRAGLAFCRSNLALMSGDTAQAAAYSREALSYLSTDSLYARSMVALGESLVVVFQGDTFRAIESLRQTVDLARRADNRFVLIVAMCALGEMQALQGHLSQALVTLEKARELASGPNGGLTALVGIVDNACGDVLRERNRLPEAKEMLERGYLLSQPEWALSSLQGMISLARLLQSEGDLQASQALMAKTYEEVLRTESSHWHGLFIAAAVRLTLQRGDLPRARRWWEEGRLHDLPGLDNSGDSAYHYFEYQALALARYDIAMGRDASDEPRLRRALALLQSLLPKADEYKRVTSKIEVLILRALLEDALGQGEDAVDTLLSALALGEPEDYQRVYLDEGSAIVDLLARCLVRQQETHSLYPSVGYVESLLQVLRPETAMTPSDPRLARNMDEPAILLSAREAEILTLLAEGKSNQEIASDLYLALNTVKRHVYNIFAKLDVQKRTQAVAKARRLGLIP